MEKVVKMENFLQSIAVQCLMPVIIQRARMIPINIFLDDAAGVPHRASYVCHPNHIDSVVKSLRRLTPVALPKVNGQARERLKGSNAAGAGISMDQAPGDGGGEEPGAAVEVGAGVPG